MVSCLPSCLAKHVFEAAYERAPWLARLPCWLFARAKFRPWAHRPDAGGRPFWKRARLPTQVG